MRHSRIAALLLGSALFSAPALAEESLLSSLVAPGVMPNHWYGDISGGVRVQNIPEIGVFNIAGSNDTAFNLNPQIVMGGGSLTLGHVFGKQLDPQIWGGRAHVSIGGHYFVGRDKESFDSNGLSLDYIDIDGGGPIGRYLAEGTADTHLRDWGVKLRGGLDFDQGDGWIFTPSIAVFGSHSDLSQVIDIIEDGGNYLDQLTNDVRNTRLGGSFGLGVTRDLGNGIMLQMGADLGVNYNETKAHLTTCLSNAAVLNCADIYDEGDRENRQFAFFANAAVGIGFMVDFMHVSIEAEGGYDSYVPTIDYGHVVGERAEIGSKGDFNYGGGITVTIPLN